MLDLSELRETLSPFYSHTGRPSIDPEVMLRMLIEGYCYGIRSERQLCEDVHLNLAYRWFCRLGLEGKVPDHSTFSENRHGRFRESDVFRHLFESVLLRCMAEGLVGASGRRISQTDPEASYTAAHRARGIYAYSTNYLVDTDHGIIVDVEATTANRSREVESTKTMIERVEQRFGIIPKRLIGDTAYGTAPMLDWIVETKHIEPHTPVWERAKRQDDTFSRSDFTWQPEADRYICPAGKPLLRYRRQFSKPRSRVPKDQILKYRATKRDCESCEYKPHCCPKTPSRKVSRSIYESSRDVARAIAETDAYQQTQNNRKKVEMLFAHLKRILKLDRLRLRGMSGARNEFLLTATAQNLRRMTKLLSRPPPDPGVTVPA